MGKHTKFDSSDDEVYEAEKREEKDAKKEKKKKKKKRDRSRSPHKEAHRSPKTDRREEKNDSRRREDNDHGRRRDHGRDDRRDDHSSEERDEKKEKKKKGKRDIPAHTHVENIANYRISTDFVMDSRKTNRGKKRNRKSSSSDDSVNEIDSSSIPPPREISSSDDSDDDTISSSSSTKKTPSQMLRTRQGILLQHRLRCNHQELKKMGVKMDKDFFSFTPEEDNIIRNNWKKYAKFHKFQGTIYEFLGFDKDGLTSKNPKIVKDFEYKFKLWSTLCSGLENRFAQLVQSRISYIFHPYYKEDEGYEMAEARRRIKNDESLSEVCESLKIPPRFMERVLANTRNKYGSGVKTSNERIDETQRIKVLQLLYESHLDDGETTFSLLSFDWKKFYAKCQKKRVVPQPTQNKIYHTFREVFANAEKNIFSHLAPAPTLKKKILYVHEAYKRYDLQPVKQKRETEKPVMSLPILFTVVFQDYNHSERWDPPPELNNLASKVDLEKMRQRVEKVKETRKRLQDRNPGSKYNVVLKKKKLSEEMEEGEASPSRSDSTSGEDTPLPPASIIGDPEELEEDPFDDLTQFEISTVNTTINNTSSSFLDRNETILAAGGAGVARSDGLSSSDTSLGSINNRSTTQKKEDTLNVDSSKGFSWAFLDKYQ